MAAACEALLAYRSRNTENFQLEKADDYFRRIRIELDLLCCEQASAPSETATTENPPLDLALAAIEQESELPGDMPDDMWEAIKGDRDAVREAMRIAVRQTKGGIRDRYYALKGSK